MITMKILIITDIEGVSGVNGRRADEVGNKIINTDVACRLLTQEVNAVVEGLIEAGADDIQVWDGHGGSNSIQIENLHPAADLFISGSDLAPVTYIDSSYNAAVQIGAHAMMGVCDGFLNHTFNSHGISNMWLNGKLIGEIGVQGLMCAYFAVPTILVSGDKAACCEAEEFFGKVKIVETKRGISRYSVQNYNPVKIRQNLKESAKDSLLKKEEFTAKNISAPYALKLQLMCPNMADNYEKNGAERVDHSTVVLKSNDLIDVFAQRMGWAPGIHNKKFMIQHSKLEPVYV